MNKALLVGINNYPTAPLNGCVNDVTDMADFLVSQCGFQENEIRLLVDERATTENILERLSWLLMGLRKGDRVVFHYSGHGVQFPTRNPQGEVDGLDEAICPVDFDWTDERTIRDKDFNRLFAAIPEGVLFTWISDSCHSGDLHRLIAKPKEKMKTMPVPADIQWRIRTAKEKGARKLGLKAVADSQNLLLVSGCQANELSADAFINNRYNGALTHFLLETLVQDGLHSAMADIIKNVNTILDQNHYDQNPGLFGSEALKLFPFLKSAKELMVKETFQ